MKHTDRNRLLHDPFLQGILLLAINVLYFFILNSKIHFITQNDDVYLAAFFNGAYLSKSAYAPFLNYILTSFLKWVYTAFGNTVPWYTLFLICTMIASFSLLSWVFLRRLRSFRALALMTVLLSLFAFDAYCCITFTTTSFISSAAGATLLFYSSEKLIKRRGSLASSVFLLFVSICFCLVGFMLRFNGFLAAFALLTPLGIPLLAAAFQGGGPQRKPGLPGLMKLFAPFLLVFVLIASLWGINQAIWSRDPYGTWLEYRASRAKVYDNIDIVPYEEAAAQYEAIGLSENDMQMIFDYKLGDSELANPQNFAGIVEISRSYYGRGTLGENLVKMVKALFNEMLHKSYVHAFGLIFIAWLITGKHDKLSLLTAAAWAVLFVLEYLVTIYLGRYAYDRVDSGLFLTGFILFSSLLSGKPGRKNSLVLLAVAAAAVFMRLAVTPSYIPEAKAEEELRYVEQKLETLNYLIDNTDYLYIDNNMMLSDVALLPYTAVPSGVCDRIVAMRGWPTHMPIEEKILRAYGVSNPYRDCIDRDDIRIIDFNIEATVAYIREHYDEDASAVIDEQLYRETGIEIYQIIG